MSSIPTCPKCGSHNIVKDAAARWDAATGDWTLASIHDHETCEDCDAQGDWLTYRYDIDELRGLMDRPRSCAAGEA